MINNIIIILYSAGHDASISDLLADVRRIKLAGDALRAVRSRPATAASSPSRALHIGATGPTVGAARQGDKQCSQESPSSDGSYSDYSSHDCRGSQSSGGYSAHSTTVGSGSSMEQLPAVTR